MFPLDPGRPYDATVMMPGGATSVSATLALPARRHAEDGSGAGASDR